MKSAARSVTAISAPWLLLALTAVLVLYFRLELSFDLSAFFPRETDLTHEILLEQLGNGPGSRLLVIGINGAESDELAEISDSMRDALESSTLFINVLNGEFSTETRQIPEPLNSYFLLLADTDFSESSLHQALQLRLQDMAMGSGAMLLDLIARDPFLATLDILERLAPVDTRGDMWFAEDGSVVIMAETRALAVDLEAQAEAVNLIKSTFTRLAEATPMALEVTGVGAFGLELQEIIRAEAKKRSLLASAALILILLVLYRNLRLVLLAALPIGLGFLVGLAALALIFDSVHGITLAFGFTLMGIAIDYPLHLFSHSRYGSDGNPMEQIWPTMRLGAISTAVAYLALSLSGSDGLAQLGIFTACGVMVAVTATRHWIPFLMKPQDDLPAIVDNPEPGGSRLAYLPAALTLVLAAGVGGHYSDRGVWDDRISSLSPVSESRLEVDTQLRSAAITPDMRYQLILQETSLEALLQDSEALGKLLQESVNDGMLGGWQSVDQILPSLRTQKIRQEEIPPIDLLRERLSSAAAETPFQIDAFEPFLTAASKARTLPLLEPSGFNDSPLASWLDTHLIQLPGRWVSLITLSQIQLPEFTLRADSWNMKTSLLDLHQSTEDLMRDYRNGALKTIGFAALAIIALLFFGNRQSGKILWIVLTVSAALAVTVTLILALHSSLTIIHIVGLLLVLGLGLDYSLFLSRTESALKRSASRHGVMACAFSTTLTFGILASSTIPVLKFLGLTVAIGSAASFVLAFAGSLLPFNRIKGS